MSGEIPVERMRQLLEHCRGAWARSGRYEWSVHDSVPPLSEEAAWSPSTSASCADPVVELRRVAFVRRVLPPTYEHPRRIEIWGNGILLETN